MPSIFSLFFKEKGFTLIEILVSMVLTALIFAGTLMIVRNIRAVDSGFEEMAGLYAEVGKINRMFRDDLAGIQKSVNMEPYTDINRDGFFNGADTFSQADDPTTLPLPYAPAINRNESAGFPGDDPATPYNESATDSENLPYGPTYDYFFGITNNGLRDALSFPGNILVGGESRPAMITYRLAERSHQCNGDTGADGLADEFEPGYHPLYHPDPNNDNVSAVFNPGQLPPGRVETEGDGVIEVAFTCPEAAAKPLYQFQRIIALASGEIDLEVISTSVVELNILYYDRETEGYVELTLGVVKLKRFGYPEDGVTPGTFDSSGLLTSAAVTDGFLNLKAGDEVYLEQPMVAGKGINPGLYRITEIWGGLRFDLFGQMPNSGPVTFRASYFPPSIKVTLTVKADFGPVSDPRALLRTIPITIFLGRDR